MMTVAGKWIILFTNEFVYFLAAFHVVRSKSNGKKCIQKDVGSITYSLKVINGTNVVFEVSLSTSIKNGKKKQFS